MLINFESVRTYKKCGLVTNTQNFLNFCNDFELKSVSISGGVPYVSANYFADILINGIKAKCPYHGEYSYDIYSSERNYFEDANQKAHFFDHSAFWKKKDGSVIFTTMPYLTEEMSINAFNTIAKDFDFPQIIKMRFLSDKYRYRLNGDCFILIYADTSNAARS